MYGAVLQLIQNFHIIIFTAMLLGMTKTDIYTVECRHLDERENNDLETHKKIKVLP